jgi:uncharacterized protein (TIGR02271 family)
LVGLGLTKEEADFYNTEFEAGRTVVTVTAPGREQAAESLLRDHGGYDLPREGIAGESLSSEPMASERMTAEASDAWMAGEGTSTAGMLRGTASENSAMENAGAMRGDDAQRMTAYEEELAVEKRPVAKRDVNVRKEVHTEHKTIEVPVQREEVVIERRAPSADSAGSMSGHQEIRIPVREEQVNVQKVPVAKEDVVVGKRTVQDTKRVSADLRKEEIKVDADPDVPIRNRRDEA